MKALSDAAPSPVEAGEEPEFSVVMPCLNEAETLAACVRKARESFRTLGIRGEVVVADNGSTDGSQALAEREGAVVAPVKARGYGSALRGGIAAARGRFVIMGDSDDSYDFSRLEGFVEKLRAGADLVMGNRFAGEIRPGAMPWKHRWIGNPVLTGIGRLFFRSPVGDFHCGLRGFAREAYRRMDLRTTGMEFASEMVIKATLLKMRIEEVPITLHRDGRSRPPHLRSWRDGWRHLRFMCLFSPLWLFLLPGGALFAAGAALAAWLVPGPRRLGGIELDIHTLLAASLMCVIGFQAIAFGLFTKAYVIRQGLHPSSPLFGRLRRLVSLEAGLLLSLAVLLAGLGLILLSVDAWRREHFGGLDPRVTMRTLIPGATLMALGAQGVFGSFFLSVQRLTDRPGEGA